MASGSGPPPPFERAAIPLRILVIEDDPDSRAILRALLELLGHRVDDAASGEEGVAKALATRPELALIDIGLPLADGYTVARQLRSHPVGRAMVLIALTGYGALEHRAHALAVGFDAHLQKPVSPEQLLRVLQVASDLVRRDPDGDP